MIKNIVIAVLLGALVLMQVLQNQETPAGQSGGGEGSDGARSDSDTRSPQISWDDSAKKRNVSKSGFDFSGKVYRVVDGDSLYIDGVKKQIRLWGVDAPERDERGYDDARLKLTELAKGQHVQCERKDTDKYGRNVARCFQRNGMDINKTMIASGLTSEYCRFTKNFYKTCR